MFIFISHSIFYLLQLSYLFLVYSANSKNTIMTDEELRTFCVEQAVLIFAKKEQVKTMGFRDMEDMTLLELSDRLYNYIRTGEQSFIPASLSYLKKNNTDLFINN